MNDDSPEYEYETFSNGLPRFGGLTLSKTPVPDEREEPRLDHD